MAAALGEPPYLARDRRYRVLPTWTQGLLDDFNLTSTDGSLTSRDSIVPLAFACPIEPHRLTTHQNVLDAFLVKPSEEME